MASKNITKNTDTAAKELCALYRTCGYKHYKMSKFEEYDFYAKNKSFLVSSNIITFTGLDGKLMALKPDVTLSIIKNAIYEKGTAEKVYYNEKVYRAEKGGHEYREITQTGLECVGDLGIYDTAEVISLAVKSLQSLSDDFILDLSHIGFISGLLSHIGTDSYVNEKLLTAVSEKNAPYIKQLCRDYGISAENEERLIAVTKLYGPVDKAAEELKQLSVNDETEKAAAELKHIYLLLKQSGLEKNVNLDFSIENDMNYYNGIIFRGYIKGIPQGILAGGSYDSLLAKMGKKANAMGFAIYLDLLEKLYTPQKVSDADILLTYEKAVPVEEIIKTAEDCRRQGYSVRVQKTDDGSVAADKKIRLTAKEA